MKANELRIGNLIFDPAFFPRREKDEVIIVTPAIINNLTNEINYKSIPLTEEWLIKLGFEYQKAFHYYKKDDWVMNGNVIRGKLPVRKPIYKELEYVHQLQNLYFALTGEELTV